MAAKDPYVPQLGLNIIQRLGDKTYKKRRGAAVAVQMLVRNLATEVKENRVVEVIRLLQEDLLHTTNANTRKGGLMALSAAAIALAEPPGSLVVYQSQIVSAVLPSFCDPDHSVRFAACEALYNIAKVSRAMMVPFFTRVFDITCKLVAEVNPLCRQGGDLIDRLLKDIITEQDGDIDLEKFVDLVSVRIYAQNADVRKFLVSWLLVLESVPGVSFLPYLHKFLTGLLKIVDSQDDEIQNLAVELLHEIFNEIHDKSDFSLSLLMPILVSFVRDEAQTNISKNISFQCISMMIHRDHDATITFVADILEVTLPMVSATVDVSLKELAVSINQSLRKTDLGKFEEIGALDDTSAIGDKAVESPSPTFDLERVLNVISAQLESVSVSTRMATLRWILMLHEEMPLRMYKHTQLLAVILLRSVADTHDRVATLALECLAEISSCSTQESTKQTELAEDFFNGFISRLLTMFSNRRKLLHLRGAFMITNLAALMGAEKVCGAISEALQLRKNPEFAAIATSELSRVILTTSAFASVRDKIRSMKTSQDGDLFTVLYKGWSHSLISTLALCLLAGAYEHASQLFDRIADLEITIGIFREAEALAKIIQQPQYSRLQIDLINSAKNPYLIRSLYGLLMLMPQEAEYHILRGKLMSITKIAMTVNHKVVPYKSQSDPKFASVNFEDLLANFDIVQEKRARIFREQKFALKYYN